MLRPDDGKAILMTRDIVRAKENERYECVIHPIHAMILSFCNGNTMDTTVTDISNFLKVSKEKIENFLCSILDNNSKVVHKLDGANIVFPPRTIIQTDSYKKPEWSPEDFKYDYVRLKLERRKMVSDITLMLNNNCMTDCIYCYANKTKHVDKKISIDVIMKVIEEAKTLKLRSFDIIGGDIFIDSNWKIVVSKLYENGFAPYLSTKVPLTLNDIAFLHEINVKDIQISLDTLIADNLCQIVKMNMNYYNLIKQTIRDLNKFGITTTIHSIICSKNDTIEDMVSIYEFIKDLEHVKKWRIDYANYSLYKTKEEFNSYRTQLEKLNNIYTYLKKLDCKNMEIMCGGINKETWKNKRPDPNFLTKNRGLCTANYNSLFILPDGNVTICEQLYWNKNFIVGNVIEQSIAEIWNSEKAKNLYNIKQEFISKRSACSMCNQFDYCRKENGGVCWKEIIAVYGEDNWDFPDPRCPKAPKLINNVYI